MDSALRTRPISRQILWVALLASLFLILWLVTPIGRAQAATDWDGDGYTDSDCAPLDPFVHPGAVDKPDLSFEDTNCDGRKQRGTRL